MLGFAYVGTKLLKANYRQFNVTYKIGTKGLFLGWFVCNTLAVVDRDAIG